MYEKMIWNEELKDPPIICPFCGSKMLSHSKIARSHFWSADYRCVTSAYKSRKNGGYQKTQECIDSSKKKKY